MKFGSDVYRQKFGVRTVSKTQTGLFINNKAFYCHGVAKHEDSDVRAACYRTLKDSAELKSIRLI